MAISWGFVSRQRRMSTHDEGQQASVAQNWPCDLCVCRVVCSENSAKKSVPGSRCDALWDATAKNAGDGLLAHLYSFHPVLDYWTAALTDEEIAGFSDCAVWCVLHCSWFLETRWPHGYEWGVSISECMYGSVIW